MKRRKKNWAIPDSVMISVLNGLHRELDKCCDTFKTYDWEQTRERCGSQYAGVPLDDVRHQGTNLRKRGCLDKVNGHGPGKTPELSPEYKKHLASEKFRAYFNIVLTYFSNRCAVCYATGKLEPHHRTYVRVPEPGENFDDCIPVCRKCHRFCDKRRREESPYTSQKNGVTNAQQVRIGLFD